MTSEQINDKCRELYRSLVKYPGVCIDDVPAQDRDAERYMRQNAARAVSRLESQLSRGPMLPKSKAGD